MKSQYAGRLQKYTDARLITLYKYSVYLLACEPDDAFAAEWRADIALASRMLLGRGYMLTDAGWVVAQEVAA